MNENKKKSDYTRIKKATSVTSLEQHGKVPPQAIELEEAVLGALMLEKDALTTVIDIIKPETFYKDSHQRIFSAIQQLFGKSEPIDMLTVANQLKNTGELDLVGGPYYISQLTSRVASAANIEFHARILSQKYIQRELIRVSSDIIRDSFEDTTDVFELLDRAEDNLFRVGESNLRRSSEDINTLLRQAVKQIEDARKHEGNIIGVPSGFTDIDRITAGWQRSDLIILAARPGMGKTAFVLTIARNAAVEHGKTVAVFSLEMSALQLVTRMISSETEISADKLRKGNLENHEWEQLTSKITKLIDAKLIIDDTPALTIFELRAKCRRIMQKQGNVDLIIIDYLQLMSGGSDNSGNREQEISNISRSLKALAKELNVPIICLSQLNRSVESRGGLKKPLLSDLRESGAIEQDADMVFFIYRPEYYKLDQDEQGNSTQGLAEIIIAKHRNGPTAEVKLKFVAQYAKFLDIDSSDFHSFENRDNMPSGDNGKTYKTFQSSMNDDDEPAF